MSSILATDWTFIDSDQFETFTSVFSSKNAIKSNVLEFFRADNLLNESQSELTSREGVYVSCESGPFQSIELFKWAAH